MTTRHARLRFSLLASLVGLALAVVPGVALARTALRVPQGFFGVDAGLPPGADPAPQFDSMVANGVESVRLNFIWAAMQPYANFGQVPADQRSSFVNTGGVPTTFTAADQAVALAASRGLSVMAIVIAAPNWDSKPRPCTAAPAWDVQIPPMIHDDPIEAHTAQQCFYESVPDRDAPYGAFLKALVQRYGNSGSFWSQHPNLPRHPIRLWTVWNEPNFLYNWGPQPFQRSYVALLRAAHAAVKSADPGAKVILAGVANFAWTTLAQIYAIRGASRYFDVVDIHPYTKQVPGVFEILRRVRAVMAQHGDQRKPIIVGEYTWPSSLGQSAAGVFGTETTEAGQASQLRAVLPLFAKNRQRLRLLGTYYFTWMGVEARGANTFNFAGLIAMRANQLVVKPALAAFGTSTLKLEQCAQKGALATTCLRPRR
jgi:hypothetical protein